MDIVPASSNISPTDSALRRGAQPAPTSLSEVVGPDGRRQYQDVCRSSVGSGLSCFQQSGGQGTRVADTRFLYSLSLNICQFVFLSKGSNYFDSIS